MANIWVVAAGIGGFAGVGLGAASTHMTHGDGHAASLISTAANFLLFHSLALLGVGALASKGDSRILTTAGVLFAAGMTVFAGGLTALATDPEFAQIWLIPCGGLILLSGWAALAVHGALSGAPD